MPIDETMEKDILGMLVAMPKFGTRYHPHVIRFCLSVHVESPSAYRELRDSGILVLPSERTLRVYDNFFKQSVSFHPENIERLRGQTLRYFDIQ